MSTKAARGTKRTCQACETRFYDLNRSPITCPSCGAVQAKDARESRRAAAPVDEEDEVVLPVARVAAAAGAGAGAVASGDDLPEIVSIEDVPEIEGEDAEGEGDGEADTFLEEEEEDGDVGTFIDNPIEGDEEEA